MSSHNELSSQSEPSSQNELSTNEESTGHGEQDQETLEQQQMHGWDFAFSLVVMIFALMVVANSLTMPFSGTVGGVTTEWYESPGLLPLFIGCSLFAAGLSVFVKSKKEQGKALLIKHYKNINPTGFLISGGGILTYIYVLITWYDFFLASAIFLTFYIGLYYLDIEQVTKQLLKIYGATVVISIALFGSGASAYLNAYYAYTTDLVLVISGGVMCGYLYQVAKEYGSEVTEKVRRLLIISFVFPAVLCPIFRYFLLVPLPNEGLVVEQVFNQTYYTYLAPTKHTEELQLSDEDMQLLEDAF
ncbi:hypothetical protein BCU70_18455 [Vibrio sp. 10N.286.49.C2]|uniref:tripartite tricarboxylate transporter TctB family protein n=1 Tax=unclassified Vibrio TaxID=2614977 RepID=UPI000C83C31E|nr:MULTISPECIES: tripartite tricarboxylate transporter TctB family protein [unclassified Vibrio]PMH35133.1 hypothetical protein BCU70_18455 [Vibrio sp. 10N.286.49.C2]PMH57077.1 hypothetical protein BCU66_06155 [Vibrio sp. 10N.286.49.B1]PMH77882.1 hypothetical protein BCU58_01090 [Vibrio sp. 10N.286.48.B7]